MIFFCEICNGFFEEPLRVEKCDNYFHFSKFVCPICKEDSIITAGKCKICGRIFKGDICPHYEEE